MATNNTSKVSQLLAKLLEKFDLSGIYLSDLLAYIEHGKVTGELKSDIEKDANLQKVLDVVLNAQIDAMRDLGILPPPPKRQKMPKEEESKSYVPSLSLSQRGKVIRT